VALKALKRSVSFTKPLGASSCKTLVNGVFGIGGRFVAPLDGALLECVTTLLNLDRVS